ncbi:MAG: tRNA(Met) cytidine acetyltransferase TmcA [Candidatus Asgardarchaeia archaeon]
MVMEGGLKNKDAELEKLKSSVSVNLENAISANHRIMVVFSGNERNEMIGLTSDLISILVEIRAKKGIKDAVKGALVSDRNSLDAISPPLKEILKDKSGDKVIIKIRSFDNSVDMMGRTFDYLIIDLIDEFNPDDLGRLVGTVSGGGMIVLWVPSFENWERKVYPINEVMASPPYTTDELRRIYMRRFIKKIMKADGIIVYDVEGKRLLKNTLVSSEVKSEKEIKLPDTHVMPIEVYEMGITQDQVDAIMSLEHLLKRGVKKRAVVVIADRGRGKSVALGIALAGISYVFNKEREKKLEILVTAPSPENVSSLLEFYEKTLRKLGVEKNEIKVFKEKGEIKISSPFANLRYLNPIRTIGMKCNILVVDEAAGIPVNLLYEMLERNDMMVFSSTTHGYEGAGRSFSIRFLKKLESRRDVDHVLVKLSEPIRYSPEDPIEKWLFDALVLDAEPAELDERDLEDIKDKKLLFKEKDLEELFTNEKELRDYIGIYIYAHYRNRPKDLAFLADAPHHKAFVVYTERGMRIVSSIQAAIEGGLSNELVNSIYRERKDYHGHLIPHAMIIHQRMPKFGKLKGLRIVRIATHPDVMRMGIGSFALEKLCEYASERKYDYLGASFGANEELLKFWFKNGFFPVHVSTERNPISGEYSVVVVKPISKKAKKLVFKAVRELRNRMVELLLESLREMDPNVAYMILSISSPKSELPKPHITYQQWEKVNCFAKEILTYDAAFDALRRFFIMYVLDLSPQKPKLNRKQIALIIMKFLQIKSWSKVADNLKTTRKWCLIETLHIVRKLLKFYMNKSIWDNIGVRYEKAKPF